MYSLKLYIIKIIIVVAILQIGAMFINVRSYDRLYSLVGGIILIGTVLSVPDIKLNLSSPDILTQTEIPVLEDVVGKTFENNLQELIQEDIYQNYKIRCEVKIKTDMEKLEIYVICNSNSISDTELYNYVKNSYCTENDKVVIMNDEYSEYQEVS